MDLDLTEELDRSFGAGPAHRPVSARLEAGRRARRRRRGGQAVTGLAVVALLGVGYAATAGGDGAGESPVVATAVPAPAGSDDQGKPGSTSTGQGLLPGELARWGPGGLELADGVRVVERVENPLGLRPPAASLGLVVDDGRTRQWQLWSYDPRVSDLAVGTTETARQNLPSFDLWLADQVAAYDGEPALALVAFGGDGALEAAEDGVEVVDQRADPGMPPGFADPAERVAVAEVTWRGATWFVLAVQGPGEPARYLPTAGSVAGDATTVAEFLVWARQHYVDGISR